MRNLMIVTGVTLAIAGAGGALSSSAAARPEKALTAQLVDASGAAVGSARLVFARGTADVTVDVQLPPAMAGFHGFHIHDVGQCQAPFTTAGGHLGERPGDAAHRHRDHDGDLPVLLVMRDGRASARVTTDRIHVRELRDADGSALVVHAGPDNYANIPATDAVTGAPRYSNPAAVPPVHPGTTTDETTLKTGDAGARIACGVLR